MMCKEASKLAANTPVFLVAFILSGNLDYLTTVQTPCEYCTLTASQAEIMDGHELVLQVALSMTAALTCTGTRSLLQ